MLQHVGLFESLCFHESSAERGASFNTSQRESGLLGEVWRRAAGCVSVRGFFELPPPPGADRALPTQDVDRHEKRVFSDAADAGPRDAPASRSFAAFLGQH